MLLVAFLALHNFFHLKRFSARPQSWTVSPTASTPRHLKLNLPYTELFNYQYHPWNSLFEGSKRLEMGVQSGECCNRWEEMIMNE